MGSDSELMDAAVEVASTERRRHVRRRIGIAFGLFVLLQAVVATIVSVRAKAAEERRKLARPETYPSRGFPEVELVPGADTAQLYMTGAELLADVVAAIDGARDQVLFETFIWVDDVAGAAVRDALDRAAARGVDVYVLWDWLMSDHAITEDFFSAAVDAHPFKRIKPGPSALRPRNLLRDHRKVIVVDTDTAFVGGSNIGDEYLGWRDTHLRVTGQSAREVANAFGDFWNQHVPSNARRLPNVTGRGWHSPVTVHRNDPSLAIFPIRGMYIEAIDRAAERVWLTIAYFVPDRTFCEALCNAARRGVDVRVMLPARSNHAVTDLLAHGLFETLLTAGVRVFLYRDFMVHAKTAVIDSAWSTIGTANLDRWSMLGNYEINLEVRNEALASQMVELFEFDLDNSDEVHLLGWKRRPISWRASERVLRSMAPFT